MKSTAYALIESFGALREPYYQALREQAFSEGAEKSDLTLTATKGFSMVEKI
jgi:hypothetical protein